MVIVSHKRLAPGFGNKRLRNRISNFLITMNTNIRVKPNISESRSEDLYQMAESIFSEEDELKKIVTFPKGGEWSDETIKGVDASSRVEIGHNMRGTRLHLHQSLKLRHQSYLRLDPEEIKRLANEKLREQNSTLVIYHVHISTHRPSVDDYLTD